LIFILIICSFSYAEEILIIGNKNIPIDRLTKREVKLIYLKKKFFIKNIQVVPVNLRLFNPLRKKFNKYVLNMDEEQLSIYWNEMYLKGIDPPIVLSSQKAVVKFVSSVNGAIGYIYPKFLNKNVKVLLKVRIK